MTDLLWYQYLLIALIFVWSGFVRSGLGFGGAVLSLPFLLLILNQPLVFLPIISLHLLFFSSLTLWQNHRAQQARIGNTGESGRSTVDWVYLRKALAIMIVPKMVGVLGLIVLPSDLMSLIIFSIVSVYSLSYIFNKPFVSQNRWLDVIFLMLGAYISGTSLIGAPLLLAVFARHVSRDQLRDTLFALWFILVSIKVAALIYAKVDLQLIHHLWLLPAAAVGHILGLRTHDYLAKTDQKIFYRVLGGLLLLVSVIGLGSGLMGLAA